MRLFIAINFNEATKTYLQDIINRLKNVGVEGSFTRQDNLHLTLVFLGEVESKEVAIIKGAMDAVIAESFLLTFSNLGRFPRKGGDIYWLGVERNNILISIYQQLYQELTDKGFSLAKRKYKPHLTLGRRIKPPAKFILNDFSKDLQAQSTLIDKISLMRSERKNGKLIYTELYAKKLIPNQD